MRASRLPLVALLLLAAGCNETGLRGAGEGDLRVTPSSLFFSPGESERTVVLSNEGDGPVEVQSLALSSSCPSCFAAAPADAQASWLLGRGEQLLVRVAFAPPANGLAQTGELAVGSDDPDSPVQSVAIASAGAAAGLVCFPSPIALAAYPGSTDDEELTCRNDGDLALTIASAELAAGSAAPLAFEEAAALPLTLAPGESAPAGIARFAPSAAGSFAGSVHVALDGAPGVDVPLAAIASSAPACALKAAPSFLSFGTTTVGTSEDRIVTLSNDGAAACALGTPSLTGSGYTLESAAPATVLPGASHDVVVRYTPAARGSHAGSAVFASDDPGSPLTVPLQGIGVAPELEILSCPLSFGTVKAGCVANRTLLVQNAGDAPLAITSINLGAGAAEIAFAGQSASSTVLAPGAQMPIALRFSPSGAGARSRTLTVTSGDADEPSVTCALSGMGASADHVVDTFQQEVQRRADVLVVVDNSGSMIEEQSTLAASFPDFVDALTADGVDFHLGVVTSDNPYLTGSPRIVTPATPNPAAAFAQNAMVGTSGSGYEQPFLSARYAVTQPIAGGWNAGFLRAQAKLFLVFVGDEDDQSSGGVSFYAASYAAVKPSASMAYAYGIGGPLNGSCAAAFPGYRLAQMAAALGGSFGNICAPNFAPVLSDIAAVAAEPLYAFPLSQVPVTGTIVVTVGGVVQPASAWSYDAASGAIVFQPGSVPADGAIFTVEYDATCS